VERLEMAVTQELRVGGRLESKTRYQAVIVHGSSTGGGAHVVFALLSIFTCGLAAIPWVIMAATQHENRVTLSVDAYGNVIRS
jgi:hypothetical protein